MSALVDLLADLPMWLLGLRLRRRRVDEGKCKHPPEDCCDICCTCRCDDGICCEGTICGGQHEPGQDHD